jgi:hypothetical protein
MSPKVVRFALTHRKLDEQLRARVVRLHRKLSVRAIAGVVGLQPSSVHALLRRDGELPRDVRKRLVPRVVSKLAAPLKERARLRVREKKKRVTAIAVRNALPTPCSVRTVQRSMLGMDTTRRRKRLAGTPLTQEQEERMNRSRNLQGW